MNESVLTTKQMGVFSGLGTHLHTILYQPLFHPESEILEYWDIGAAMKRPHEREVITIWYLNTGVQHQKGSMLIINHIPVEISLYKKYKKYHSFCGTMNTKALKAA